MSMNLDQMAQCFKRLVEIRENLNLALKTQSYDALNHNGEQFVRSASFLYKDIDELIKLHQFTFMEYEIDND